MGVVSASGEVLVSETIPTPSHGEVDRYIGDLSTVIRRLMASAVEMDPELRIVGVGIGAPNANYYKGTIEHAPNLSFKGVVPFVDRLKAHLPELNAVAITNDANAAALGEMIYGGAKGMQHFAMFTLGTGVGCGLVVNGNLVYGHDGFAGECGHTVVVPDGRSCGCGGKGHLEAYCSASGMKRTAFELLVRDNNSHSVLANTSFNSLTSKMIYEAAVQGDALAVEVFRLTGQWLGQALAETVHHLSPEAIFLFGGPMAAGELLLAPIRESMEAHLLPVFRNKVQLLPSLLKAGDAAIVGASALVYQELPADE